MYISLSKSEKERLENYCRDNECNVAVVWEYYTAIMERNFMDDIGDIVRENDLERE